MSHPTQVWLCFARLAPAGTPAWLSGVPNWLCFALQTSHLKLQTSSQLALFCRSPLHVQSTITRFLPSTCLVPWLRAIGFVCTTAYRLLATGYRLWGLFCTNTHHRDTQGLTRPPAATKPRIAERNEKRRKKGARDRIDALGCSPFFVFFRFLRLYSFVFFSAFLVRKTRCCAFAARTGLEPQPKPVVRRFRRLAQIL